MDPIEAPLTGAIEPEAKTFGMLAHVAAFAGWVIPFGNIFGPLIVWLMKKDQYPFVDAHGKESLNFQLTMGIVHLVLIVIAIVSCGIALIVTAPLNLLLLIAGSVLSVMGGLAANKGETYTYPFTWRLIK